MRENPCFAVSKWKNGQFFHFETEVERVISSEAASSAGGSLRLARITLQSPLHELL